MLHKEEYKSIIANIKKELFTDDIIKIAKKIKENNGRLYLVGGAVRDAFIKNENSHDEDYCVEGISEELFCKIFPESIKRGKAFEVFDINNREFALARKEIKTGKGHKEFKIETNNKITIKEDLLRRDITINAIAIDVLSGKIIDPYNGIKDIKNKQIRAISESFKEDPLRVYRVARFASKLDFEVEEKTLKLMNRLKSELIYLSKERVFEELRKALNTNNPSKFFDILKKADVLDVHFKEIYNLIGVEQPVKYHPEGDAYNHTMLALEMCTKLTKNEIIRFCVLVHDLGKGVTPKEMYPHHYGHEIMGIKQVENFCKRINTPKMWMKCAKIASREHMRAGKFNLMNTAKKVTFIETIDKTVLGLDALEIVVESDRNCRGTEKSKVEFAEIGKMMLKEIDGNYIKKKYNLKEGIQIKERMHQERIKWMNQRDGSFES